MRAAFVVLVAFASSISAANLAAAPRSEPGPRSTFYDYSQKIDANNISMFLTNFGTFAWDLTTFNAGLEFPKGSGKTAVFASGLWVGALVNGLERVALAEYSSEYAPGVILSNGSPDNPMQATYKVYRLKRHYTNPMERDSVLLDYELGAVPHGAPPVTVLGDGTLDILGDQMAWAVYNDADPANHINHAGSTAPLGVEVQQTTYAFDRPGALGNTVFLKFKIANKGFSQLTQFYAALWSDPDVGAFTDDLVGCDSSRALGYGYNATDTDAVYGATPPAVGYDLLRGGLLPGGERLGATAFIKYINGTDPSSALQTYAYMRGLDAQGGVIVDPTTQQPTTFMHSGDPVLGTGWIDSLPSDRRFLLVSGPYTLDAGQEIELDAAIIIGDGEDRLASVTRLRAYDDEVQGFFNGEPPPPPCEVAMGFDLNPNTINLRSMGRWVSARLEPAAPFTPEQIDVPSILLNGTLAVAEGAPIEIGDADGNGVGDLKVKFDRQALKALLPEGASVPVTVSGAIGEGCFTGVDGVRVIHANVTAPAELSIFAAGSGTTVRWETPTGVQVQRAAVLFSPDDGANWTLQADHLPNSGYYAWTVPNAYSDRCRIAVVLVEATYPDPDIVEGVVGMGARFSIQGTTDVPAETGDKLVLHGVVPNPGRGALRVQLTLAGGQPATLNLHDLAGRLVRSRDLVGLTAGPQTIELGRGDGLQPGIYWVRLTQNGVSRAARAVLLE